MQTIVIRFRLIISGIFLALMLLLSACTPSETNTPLTSTPSQVVPATQTPTPAGTMPENNSIPPAVVTDALSEATLSLPLAPVTTTVQCTERLIPPAITEAQPKEISPGIEITVSGTGGYIQDNCGGYNESARTFKLYLDQKQAADLICYVNRCQGKVTLDASISPGQHCLSAEPGGCEYQFQVNP